MRKHLGLFILISGVLILAGCKKGGTEVSVKVNRFEESAFTLSYPSNWREGKAPETIAAFFGPEKDGFKPNITISKDQLKQAVEPLDYASAAERQQALEYPHFALMNQKELRINGRPAAQRLYRWVYKGSVEIRQIQVYMMKGRTVYVLTGSNLEKNWDDTRTEFGSLLSSFKLK